MSVRAGCVVLNKGDYILDALHRAGQYPVTHGGHQHKKTTRLRALNEVGQAAIPPLLGAVNAATP